MAYRLVIVEDESEIVDLLRVVLASPQVELLAATTGHEGLALIQDMRPDLAILDIMLPGELDGWAVFDDLRAHPAFQTLPVIMLTVLRQQAERVVQFRDTALNQYLSKPFNPMVLREHVERMLGRPGLWPAPSAPLRDVVSLLNEAAEALNLDRPPDLFPLDDDDFEAR